MKGRKPKFEQYQSVTLHWNGHDYPTTIIQRLFDPDREQWFYRVNLREFIQLVTISNLSSR
ncbi:MAG: hypothetical protein NTU99_06270 [Pseudanabaena sp. LacPavin_0818_WC45_MAG_42_6]|nr:hypothetical protein [Pseudanabaena sp. LacPavin_0818_WC45_MAG_42_6]